MIKTPLQDALENFEAHTYSLKVGQNKDFILVKDGAEVFCPYLNPIPVPNQIAGGFGLMRMPCSTGCAFATLKHNLRKDKRVYQIGCNSKNELELEIEPENQPPQRPPLTLV